MRVDWKMIGWVLGVSLVVAVPMALWSVGFFKAQNNQAGISQAGNWDALFVGSPSEQPTVKVQTKVVAAKLDLERKVITPSSPEEVEKIKSVIEANGGQVINTGGGVVVAEVPKETEDVVENKLVQEGATAGLEVDYPVFLSAESADWGVVRVEAPEVWNDTKGAGVRVAVVDTGVDYTHPELQGRYGGGYDFVNDDADPIDDHGHGTHVAGIVAADMNGSGIIGVGPELTVLAAKVLGADGSGYISDVVKGVDWAMKNGAAVVNMSLGTTYDSVALKTKLDEAAAAGVVLVAAAGNTNGGAVLYPAAYDSVISVAATDSQDKLASFSSIGAEIAAPGVGITSTIPGGAYASWSGTSMASPHVAATLAMMIGNGQKNVRQLLHDSALDIGPVGVDSYFGYGLVDAKPAVLGIDTLAPLVTIVSPSNNSEVSGPTEIRADIQDESVVAKAEVWIDGKMKTSWDPGSDYSYVWNTAREVPGVHVIAVKAEDEYGNQAEVQIKVTVVALSDETETPEASDEAETDDTYLWESGNSSEVRQDTEQSAAEENRQNDVARQLIEQIREKWESTKIPDVSNINQRNRKPESDHGKSEDKDDEEVKGVSTSRWWLSLWEWFVR